MTSRYLLAAWIALTTALAQAQEPPVQGQPPSAPVSQDTIAVELRSTKEKLREVMEAFVTVGQLACDAPRWKVKNVIEKDRQSIRDALQAYGYYQPTVEISMQQNRQCWSVSYNLLQGRRTRIKTVDVRIEGEAHNDADFQKAINEVAVEPGDRLLHANYETLKKTIQSTAAKRGYLDGNFTTAQLKVIPVTHQAEVILHYQSGDRYQIGELRIEQDALKSELFSKYLQIESGDLYNDIDFTETYQALTATGYFASVEVTPLIGKRKDGRVPVSIVALKGKTKRYSVGVGASTDIGPRFKFEHNNKLVNKRGHAYSTGLSLSPVLSDLGFAYRIPIDSPQTDFIEFNSNLVHENTDTANSDTFDLGASYNKLVGNDWMRIVGLHFSIDDFDVGEDSDTTTLLRPTLGFSKTRSNSPLWPTRGYRLNIQATAASSAVISDIDFIQGQINAKWVRGLGDKWRVLARTDLGYTETSDFEELPSNLRFFAGGDQSVRGYDYESLGPEDDNDDVVGGKALVVTSLETDYTFRPNWAVATFVDAGNAFNTSNVNLKVGAGVGVRWRSPIGPIRVDIAFPVDEPDADDSWRLHFSLGPDL